MDGSCINAGLPPAGLLDFINAAFESLDEDAFVTNITAYRAGHSFSRGPDISLGDLHSTDVPIAFSQTIGYPDAIQNVSGMILLCPQIYKF